MIFFINIVLLVTVSILLKNGQSKKQRWVLSILYILILTVPMGLRDISYAGVDTLVYANDFRAICSLHDVLEASSIQNKDHGFYFLSYIYSFFSTNENSWIFACSLFYITTVTRMIHKYSKNMLASILMFIFFEYYLFNFQLMRHCMALGFIILSFDALNENNIKKFFCLLIIACSMNITAIVFLPVLVMLNIQIGIIQWVLVLIGCSMVYLAHYTSFLNNIILLICYFTGSDRFYSFLSPEIGGRITFAIQIVLFALSWLVYVVTFPKCTKNTNFRYINDAIDRGNSRYIVSYSNLNLLMNMAAIASVLFLTRIIIGEGYRIAQFYGIFSVILIPNVLEGANKYFIIKWALIVFIMLFGLWHFYNGFYSPMSYGVYNPYIFFWE